MPKHGEDSLLTLTSTGGGLSVEQLSTRRRAVRSRGWSWLTPALALLLLPSAAFGSVGKQSYEGPAATQGVNGRDPTVRVKIQFKKVHHRRARRASSSTSHSARSRSAAGRLDDLRRTRARRVGRAGRLRRAGDTGQRVNRKGHFAASGPGADESDTQTLTGHVSKKGSATGTSGSWPCRSPARPATPGW